MYKCVTRPIVCIRYFFIPSGQFGLNQHVLIISDGHEMRCTFLKRFGLKILIETILGWHLYYNMI